MNSDFTFLLKGEVTMIGTPTIDELKTMIFQLPIEEQMTLIAEISERLDTANLMKLAETGFAEWNDPEEDIYNDEA